jgi:transcriptional regulator with XRE-family HTH domain
VAGRIKTLRYRFDRTQEQFASLVGVLPETVTAWELGEGIVLDQLVRIADRTGASLDWLISGLSPERLEFIRGEATRSAVRLRAGGSLNEGRGVGEEGQPNVGRDPFRTAQ